jgi:enterochelin esterase-like enzyme
VLQDHSRCGDVVGLLSDEASFKSVHPAPPASKSDTTVLRFSLLSVLLLAAFSTALGQAPAPTDANALVQKIQGELNGPPSPDSSVDPSIPHGEILRGTITDSSIYPGTENDFQVYVPAQYDPAKPACLLVRLDGLGVSEGTVLDNLIAKKEVPIIIGVGISPGTVWKDPAGTPKRQAFRFNRSYEFDSMNDHFPDFVLNELLAAVEKLKTHDGRIINISPDGNDHAATGASTGGIGSFTLAWQRPDQFTRVYDVIGTFVSMRGGNEYPALIRKTEPKPIRIFLEDGSADAWNPLFGSWYDANVNMESALSFAGYDVAHAWGTFSRCDALALARLSGSDQGWHFEKHHASGNHLAG